MSTNPTGQKIRLLRSKLGLNQTQFGTIFSGSRNKDNEKGQRAISHWENGKASPSSDHLEQLLDFLEEPAAYLAILGVSHPNRTALSLCPPFDPKSDYIKDPGESVFPVDLQGRRKSLEDIVHGILDPDYELRSWSRHLSRCFFGVSLTPLKPLRMEAKHRDGSQVSKEWETSFNDLKRDIKEHGLPCFLTIRTILSGNASLKIVLSKLLEAKIPFFLGWGGDSNEPSKNSISISDDIPGFLYNTVASLLQEETEITYPLETISYSRTDYKELEFFAKGVKAAQRVKTLSPRSAELYHKLSVGLHALRHFESSIFLPARRLLALVQDSLWDVEVVKAEFLGLDDEATLHRLITSENSRERKFICYSQVLAHPMHSFGGFGLGGNPTEDDWRRARLELYGTASRLFPKCFESQSSVVNLRPALNFEI